MKHTQGIEPLSIDAFKGLGIYVFRVLWHLGYRSGNVLVSNETRMCDFPSQRGSLADVATKLGILVLDEHELLVDVARRVREAEANE